MNNQKLLSIALIINLAFYCGLGFLSSLTIPRFELIYAEMELDLPGLTQLIIDVGWLMMMLIFIAIFGVGTATRVWRDISPIGMDVAYTACLITSMFTLALCTFGIFLPLHTITAQLT